jgi:hypothetical protein
MQLSSLRKLAMENAVGPPAKNMVFISSSCVVGVANDLGNMTRSLNS